MKRKQTDERQDYSEEFLYPDPRLRNEWKKPDDLGDLYSESLIGGEDKSMLNPWQGPQEEVKAEQP